MPNVTYDIITKSNGEFSADFNTGDPNNWTRGQSASFTFEVDLTEENTTLSTDTTITGSEDLGNLTVETGVTLTIDSGATLFTNSLTNNGTIVNNGTLINGGSEQSLFEDFVDWAGSFTTLEMLDSVVKYRTQVPTSTQVESLVWGIEPSTDLQNENVVGVWGLVESIQNQRNQPLTTNRYQVNLTVLAPLDEYATISDVEADLVI